MKKYGYPFLAMFFLLLITMISPANAAIFKWLDENGDLQFSDKKPKNAQAETLLETKYKYLPAVVINLSSVGYNISPEFRQQIESSIKNIYAVYSKVLFVRIYKPVEVNLTIYNSQKDFNNNYKKYTDKPLKNARGVFIQKVNTASIWNFGKQSKLLTTIRHEVSHVIFHQISKRAPLWLNEGLAEYFETIHIKDNSLWVKPLKSSMKRLKKWERSDHLMALNKYLRISNHRWREMVHHKDQVPYTMAWSISYFLMSKPTGKQIISKLLNGMKINNQYPDVKLLNNMYIGRMDSFEFFWKQWVKSNIRPHKIADNVSI